MRHAETSQGIGFIELPTFTSDNNGLVRHGRVSSVHGLSLEVNGLHPPPPIGGCIECSSESHEKILAEVVSFRGGTASAVARKGLEGLQVGARAEDVGPVLLRPCSEWLGRVVDPVGQPLDGLGGLPRGGQPRALRAPPPPAGTRARLGPRIDLGVRALDAFATCRRGQRLGLFAASGVGKSSLMSMLARHADCDVAVIGLVGERGRELREFIEDDLGPAGLRRSVVVCATSDSAPLMRRDAALAAMAVAEHFRDAGKHVLLMMDSVTRFAMALREIGLSAGEPPATRGFPPSVFAELPRLLERAGPGREGCGGSITGIFTVLVEGDDHDEPVADAVRGILDGHVVLDRRIGEGGRYPAVDVLRSLSRTVPGCLEPAERDLLARARRILSLHRDMADMVRLGAYRAGSDPAVDEAMRVAPAIEDVLRQGKDENGTVAGAFAALALAMETA
ncbi:flagellar protein export ATPase FliI [Roseomonas sp. SSH11]|uniref:Flagellar protein export ATPase FliI n=1 Tax=Pararoseomonas baculiformis TaxID=2820812 RepID=A0ABS4AF66_9PROT|nr:FliI/YscN family ATPase [Pararoseomonas baculiformis]MBP0444894.1 flagellar protein export ATPase FliI [Pararoseomonas baculiformis]